MFRRCPIDRAFGVNIVVNNLIVSRMFNIKGPWFYETVSREKTK